MRRKPNLLLVLVDQMRHMSFGYAGDSGIHTPALDSFAKQGASMDCAVSNIPVCTPARACLLTGRYPLSHTTITNNSMLPLDIPSMGRVLKDAGYRTGYIGKWHLSGEAFIGKTAQNLHEEGYVPPGEMRHGFDSWAVHHCSHAYNRGYYYRDEPKPIPFEGWEPDVQTDLAIDFIRRSSGQDHEDREPFFLMLSWGPPHTPFEAPDRFEKMYDPRAIRLRENVSMSGIFLDCDSMVPRPGMTDPEEALRIFTARYYAAISSLDWNFARLLGALDEMGMREDTIVVFTSDHGEMLGSHGHMHKGQPWDESIRIPFLIRYPQVIKAGLRSRTPFGLPDILPTLVSLMDVKVPEGVEGADFSTLLSGQPAKTPASTLLIWPCNAISWGKRWNDLGQLKTFPPGFMRPYRGVRTERHTYVRDLNGPWFLYDNERDPFQMNNLAGSPDARQLSNELEKELCGWLDRTGDEFKDSDYYRDNIELLSGAVMDRKRFRRF